MDVPTYQHNLQRSVTMLKHCSLTLNASKYIRNLSFPGRDPPGIDIYNFRENHVNQISLLINLVLHLKILIENKEIEIWGKIKKQKTKQNKPNDLRNRDNSGDRMVCLKFFLIKYI